VTSCHNLSNSWKFIAIYVVLKKIKALEITVVRGFCQYFLKLGFLYQYSCILYFGILLEENLFCVCLEET
jgi:hypothetical protein